MVDMIWENLKRVNKYHELDPLQYLAMNSYGLKYKAVNDGTSVLTNYEPSEKKMQNIATYLARRNYIIGDGNNRRWTLDGIRFIGSKNYFKLVPNNGKQPREGSTVHQEVELTLVSGVKIQHVDQLLINI